MPLFTRKRREPSVITRADRAREAGQWQLAAGFYRIALDRNPHNPPIWIQYGHALKECGNRADAEAVTGDGSITCGVSAIGSARSWARPC